MNGRKKIKLSESNSNTGRSQRDFEFSAALDLLDTAVANADKARADVAEANARASRAGEELERALEEALRKCSTHGSGRASLLVKALGMLGSDHVRERDKAGRTAERVWIRENGIWRQETIRDEHDGFGDDEDLDDDELDDDDLDDEE